MSVTIAGLDAHSLAVFDNGLFELVEPVQDVAKTKVSAEVLGIGSDGLAVRGDGRPIQLEPLGQVVFDLCDFLLALSLQDRAETVWDPLESTCRHASLSIL